MTPTILKVGGLRFYFFSREEPRPHVHVQGARGEAKFWIEPRIELAADYGLGARMIARARQLIQENEDEIRSAWGRHFGG
jgi:hypothetical protein